MTQPERIALISAGISWRYHDYLRVIELHPATIHQIRMQTGFSVAFITKCREIAGIKKKNNMKEISKEAAIKIYESGIYNEMTDIQIVEFQLFQRFLAVPFQVFKGALSRVLGRDVYTHEFANAEALQKEFLGEKDAPTFEEIIAPIKDKVTFIL